MSLRSFIIVYLIEGISAVSMKCVESMLNFFITSIRSMRYILLHFSMFLRNAKTRVICQSEILFYLFVFCYIQTPSHLVLGSLSRTNIFFNLIELKAVSTILFYAFPLRKSHRIIKIPLLLDYFILNKELFC